MQPVFIVDFMSTFFANILTQKSTTYTSCYSKMCKWYFSVSVHKTCQAQWNFFLCAGWTAFMFIYIKTETSACSAWYSCVWLYPIQERCYTSIAWWMATGTSSTRHKIYYSDQCEGVTASDHQRTTTVSLKHYYQKCWLLKVLCLTWIYIYSQLQTNMWDAFQGRDCITQNYVAFTWISSWSNVTKWGCIASQDTNSTILLLYCECVMQGSKEKNSDWNKGAWIILWWSGGDGEELG